MGNPEKAPEDGAIAPDVIGDADVNAEVDNLFGEDGAGLVGSAGDMEQTAKRSQLPGEGAEDTTETEQAA